MGRSRKARRRGERARAKRGPVSRPMSLPARVGLLLGGIGCVLAGVALLTAGSPGTASRLGRIAGILIVIGIVACIVAAVGRL